MNEEIKKHILAGVYPFSGEAAKEGQVDDQILHEIVAMKALLDVLIGDLKKHDPEGAAGYLHLFKEDMVATQRMLDKLFENYNRTAITMMKNELIKQLHPDDPYRLAVKNAADQLYEEITK